MQHIFACNLKTFLYLLGTVILQFYPYLFSTVSGISFGEGYVPRICPGVRGPKLLGRKTFSIILPKLDRTTNRGRGTPRSGLVRTLEGLGNQPGKSGYCHGPVEILFSS